MLEATNYRIKEFPEGNDYWRVEWIGDIRFRTDVRSEPSMKVFMTRLMVQFSHHIYPFQSEYIDLTQNRIIEIGVGQLPMIWKGSVWRNGYRIDDGLFCESKSFEVNTLYASAASFGSSHQITTENFPIGRKTQENILDSSLTTVPTVSGEYKLIIPTIELIRFYYIYSSSSARALFLGMYRTLIREYSKTGDDVKIKLAWYALKGDAWMLARYMTSSLMATGTYNIYSWVQLSTHYRSEYFMPISYFPFEGITQLTAEGTTIVDGDGKEWFLATRLKHCTHEMPYRDVTVIRERRQPRGPGGEKEPPFGVNTWPIDLDDMAFGSSEESDRNVERMILSANEDRFLALKGKKLKEVYEEIDGEYRLRRVDGEAENKTGIGTSEGTYAESDLLPGEINQNVQPEDDPPPVLLLNFIIALRYLRAKNLTVTTVQISRVGGELLGERISHFETNGTKKKPELCSSRTKLFPS